MPVPVSTYRVQLHAGFPFPAAAAAAEYLAALGVTHLYCSPYLAAAPGSTHGYDVVDHARLNPELGGPAGYAALVDALHEAGLRSVLDIVPNHMAIGTDTPPDRQNPRWGDVLRHGRDARSAAWFDIDWDGPASPGRVLVPVLGDQLGECLDKGEITIDRDAAGAATAVRYYRHVLPVAPGTEHLGGNLLALLDAQHYRLCHWRLAGEELNYRRFFDITTLAGIRVEQPEVFRAAHALVLDQVRGGLLDGLRIDHPDGLADPAGYLQQLTEASGGTWVVVEKILEPGEDLPRDWRCAGTTGYEVLNRVTRVFVDPAGERELTDLYVAFTGEPGSYEQVVRAAKHLVVRDVLGSEVNRLVDLLARVCRADPHHRDHSRRALREALVAVLTEFGVYRAYVAPGREPSTQARAEIEAAADAARAAVPARAAEIDLVASLALGRSAEVPEAAEFTVRFQQTCGPVMAKGVEDTAFYRYHRLTALNEVGGDPGSFGLPVAAFHDACEAAQRDRPESMTTLSTHDTKRSEDVRARLALLSEIPQQWAAAVRRWSALAQRYRRDGLPDPNLEYLAYQTLVGAWPLPLDRALRYLEKASREAKQHTSWTDPDPAYDKAVAALVTGLLADAEFLADLEAFVAPLVGAGRTTSLAQKLVQLTIPGVPDTYQGSELWDLSLVDPDNRRPVDYGQRERQLAELDSGALDPGGVLARADEGLPKLLVVSRALRLRREHPEWFGPGGSYRRLAASGARSGHVLAFSRAGAVVTVVPRLVLGLAGDWADTAVELPPGRWHDVLTLRQIGGGTAVPLAELLAAFPVALLARA